MINATKEKLDSFFTSNLQFVVPFFQRSYVWKEPNWEILWEHVDKIVSNGGAAKDEHFIGTLITKQQQSERITESKQDLIDGQQRLTTVSLMLKAIENRVSGDGDYKKLKEKTRELVVFENSKGEEFLRIEHSRNDKEYFETIMLDGDMNALNNQEHRILECYKYFFDKLETFNDEKLDILKSVVLNNVPIISMLLSPTDDEQEIFDTINSLGVKLTTGELLKNYIFKDKELQSYYETHWFKAFEEDEEQIEFWNKDKTSGRVIRTNIEVLLYCYLIIQTRSAVELEKLFNQYKNWLQKKNKEEKITFLDELKEYATSYASFPEGTAINEISFSQDEERFFHVIENLEITTVYPLVLYLYKKVTDQSTRLQLLKILESYLVRRNVCRLTTKNYNNLFIQVISKLIEKGEVSVETFKQILMGFTEDTNKFPSDVDFKKAFNESALSNANAREILYCISLYQIFDAKSDITKLSSLSYSVEHMMPKKWDEHWNKPGMTEDEKYQRNKKLKTLGNLTLVTKNLNSSMKNSAWDNKKNALKEYSHLKITTDYLEQDEWDETKIDNRANDLAINALNIWPI